MSDRVVYLGDHIALTRLKGGPKIFVDTRDLSLAPHILLDSEWETWVVEVFLAQLTPTSVVIDIGANCGVFTLLAAHQITPPGLVVAVEPVDEVATLLERSIEINGMGDRVEVHRALVTDLTVPEGVPFNVTPSHLGECSIYQPGARSGPMVQRMIPTTTLDALCAALLARTGRTPDVIKIDTEGADYHVFLGGQALLMTATTLSITFEVNGPLLRQAGVLPSQMVAFLRERGFRLSLITPEGPAEVTPAVLSGDCFVNILARKGPPLQVIRPS